jgi:hypothetical protein
VKNLGTCAMLALICLTAGGCGWFDRKVANVTGWSTHCVEGVKYIQFASGASVMYAADGKVKTC